MTMKIVSINNNPSACEDGGCIRRDVTSLDAIVNNIDTCEGRNAALKAYVYALRDLQVAHNDSAHGDASLDDIDKAEAAVANGSTGWSSANTRSIGFQPICREEKIRHDCNRYIALPSVRQAIRAGRARDHRLDVNRRVGNRASGLLAPMAEARTITNPESHEGFSQPPMKARTQLERKTRIFFCRKFLDSNALWLSKTWVDIDKTNHPGGLYAQLADRETCSAVLFCMPCHT
jgi:hypothetical protein